MTPLRCTALAALVLLPAATVAVARPASPAPHVAASAPQLRVDRTAVKPGETLTLDGRGFPRNAHLALLAGPSGAEPQRIGGAQTSRRGRFTATIRIRAHSSAGAFVALACLDGCRVKASTRFRIVAP